MHSFPAPSHITLYNVSQPISLITSMFSPCSIIYNSSVFLVVSVITMQCFSCNIIHNQCFPSNITHNFSVFLQHDLQLQCFPSIITHNRAMFSSWQTWHAWMAVRMTRLMPWWPSQLWLTIPPSESLVLTVTLHFTQLWKSLNFVMNYLFIYIGIDICVILYVYMLS